MYFTEVENTRKSLVSILPGGPMFLKRGSSKKVGKRWVIDSTMLCREVGGLGVRGKALSENKTPGPEALGKKTSS